MNFENDINTINDLSIKINDVNNEIDIVKRHIINTKYLTSSSLLTSAIVSLIASFVSSGDNLETGAVCFATCATVSVISSIAANLDNKKYNSILNNKKDALRELQNLYDCAYINLDGTYLPDSQKRR